MSSIDERVVGMKFDNAQFEQGIRTTLASLEALNQKLKLEGATKGLTDVSAAAQHVQIGHISSAVDGIAEHFHAMSIVAITALATIAHEAVTTGFSLAKSLTIDPVKSGLEEYQTNINSIQTILSNTRWQNTGLEDVNVALDTLNRYSDQTIYNFSQMARNIGTFTAAGVKLDVATNAIKGIANLAAVSGSSAEQASSAMYQLSQALATGTLKLIDWNSVVNAGMGGKVFQDALMETARVHGVAIDAMLKDAGSFRATLEQGWLTADVLTETLQKFTGDLTREQIISMGYTEQQADEIVAMGKDAQDAATKVKTITQLLSTLREAAGSGWAKTWQLIFGDFEEARGFFTQVNDTLSVFIQASADARNKLIGDWKTLGGRTVLIEAISNAFHALIAIIKPIKEAFSDMFPAITAEKLYKLTLNLRYFTETLMIGEEAADRVRRTFAGVFALFGIGWDIVKRLAMVFFDLFGFVGGGASDFLEVTASVGDFLVALRQALNDGEELNIFFARLTKVLSVPIKLFIQFAKAVASVFGDWDATGDGTKVAGFIKNFGPLGTLADLVVFAWAKVSSTFSKVWATFEPLANRFSKAFKEVSDALGGFNFETILHALNTAGLLSLVGVLYNALSGRGGISGAIEQLTDSLSAMQHTLQAATLLEVALAIGVLAVSIAVLSKIDAEGLAKALAAISVMFVQLIAALAVLTALPGNGIIRINAMAIALVILAVAVGALAISVKMLSDLSWKELIKGLLGVTILLAAITTASVFLPDGARLIGTGIALLILAAGIKVLASAVTDLSGLSWEEMAKGLVGVGALLLGLTLFSRFAATEATGVLAGAGIVLLAAGIKILASAVMDLSGISWENIGKGMAVLATSLLLITGALILIPPTAPLSATAVAIIAASLLILAEAIKSISGISWENVGKGMAVLATSLLLITAALVILSDMAPTAILSAGAVFIVAVAIQILAKALAEMSQMSWVEIAKGIVVLAGALAVIVLALYGIEGAIGGAFALLIVSGALAVLASVMKVLGEMSWEEILRGLVALAAVFIVIGVAGLLLEAVIPALLGLGVAIALIGAGLALAGAGVFLFAAGLTALGAAGAIGAAAVVAIVSAVIGLIPMLVEQVGIALLLLIHIIADAAPQIVEMVLAIIIQLLEGIDKLAPKLVETLLKLLIMLLVVLVEAIPQMYEAGLKILIGILEGIRNNIRQVVHTAAQVIREFIGGIGDSLPGIIQAGVDLIFAFIRGLTMAINANSEAMGNAGADLAIAIINGMVRGLTSFGGRVSQAARNVASNALNAAKSFLGIASPSKEFIEIGQYSSEGMAIGLTNYSGMVAKSATEVGATAVDSLRESLSGLSDLVQSDMDLTPTITPVLDLTDVKKNASQIGNLLSTKPLEMNTTYKSANAASAGYQDNKDAATQNGSGGGDTYNSYTQNNNSPKALSSAEIYRQTKNQLSSKKGGLPT